jgi:2-polyprenyl-3-methyl-5-hydroxy-6-metoxy-1,4-benzoquinol methylase
MNKQYWDTLAETYDADVFSVIQNDRADVVRASIKKLSSRTKTATDLGCGPGKFLPLLADSFRHVYAVDISRSCLKQAKVKCSKFTNISYLRADFTARSFSIPPSDLLLCVNSLLIPSITKRSKMFQALTQQVNPKGHLLLVVPSLESAFLSDFRLIEWNLKSGLSPSASVRCGFSNNPDSASRLAQGIVETGDVPTKHYLKEELLILLKDLNFEVLSTQKVEYDWSTEFPSPPHWMKEPYPWDWLIIGQKTS